MKIAVDMDDVVVDMNQSICDSLEREYGVKISLQEILHWGWWTRQDRIDFGRCKVCNGTGVAIRVKIDAEGLDMLGDPGQCHVCSGEGKRTMWNWFEEHAWLWAKFEPIVGSIGGLKTLELEGHDCYLVTSKPEWAKWTVWEWCATWKPSIKGIVVCDTGESKLDVVGDWADALVDDKPSTVEEWAEDGRLVLCYDRPWNRELQEKRGDFAVAVDWNDVVHWVGKVAT